jgi:ATP-dependent DNA helicase RecG
MTEKLNQLLSQPKENEVVEFKQAKNSYDFTKLGKYFSALSNEANLKGADSAWLVFGVEDKTHRIVGSEYRDNDKLNSLKKEIADKTTNRISFIDIYEVDTAGGRVVMFQIPPAPRGIPVAFEGHYYGRENESLSALNIEEIERIRNQGVENDWSVKIIPEATFDDLDPAAVKYAREKFAVKFPDMKDDVFEWDDVTFLNKAKITIKGKITNTSIILLGKGESEHFLSPSIAKIRWILKTAKNEEKDYDIFAPPLLMAIDKVYEKIRNLKYRYLPQGTLFPNELLQYEPFNIREALNNCVAHNDYLKAGYINVVEFEDERLVFSNYGNFIPGCVEKVIMQDAPEERYRNRFLANAMFQLGLVDTRGGGIKKMYKNQIKRYFPLPDYDIEAERTQVTLTGKILDLEFANILTKHPDLDLQDIFLLDKVQKRKVITADEYRYLKKNKYVEGRKQNIFLSQSVVEKIKDSRLKEEYEKNKGVDKDILKEIIYQFIQAEGIVDRALIETAVWDKLPNVLSVVQKKNRVKNLLQDLRKEEKIAPVSYGLWKVV